MPTGIWEGSDFDWILGQASVIDSLGPIVLPNGLAGAVYHRFLVKDLLTFLGHAPLHLRQHMWFMHDGTTHVLRIVRQGLNQTFGEQWIGRGGPVSWPARSPDLMFWISGGGDT
jgi:hypothetical protein